MLTMRRTNWKEEKVETETLAGWVARSQEYRRKMIRAKDSERVGGTMYCKPHLKYESQIWKVV